MSAMHDDERLASVLHDWWWNQPLAGLDDEHFTHEAAAMADMRSLVKHLDEHGFAITATSGAAPSDASDKDTSRPLGAVPNARSDAS